MPDTPLLEYQRRRAEAARDAVRQPTPEQAPPARRYAEARAMVREALTFSDALEAGWSQLMADAEADLIPDFVARGVWLRDFFDRIIAAMGEILDWARREGEALRRAIPRTAELAAAVEDARGFRADALACWPDPHRDCARSVPPTEQTNGTGDRGEATGAGRDFPAVGTPEWGQMNQRRAELIRKKNRQGLSPDEQVEYERLQRLSHETLETRFPRPSMRSVPDEGRR